MPMSSFSNMAKRACIRNLNRIEDVGDAPYELVESILKRIDNPDHLVKIETNSPQIADRSAPLWQAFIIRDVQNGKAKMLFPKNPRSWHKVYSKMMKQEQLEKQDAEETLKKALMGLREERGATQFINKVVPRPGRPQAFVDGVRNIGRHGPPAKAPTAARPLQAIRRSAAYRVQQQQIFTKKVTRNNIPSVKTQIKVAPQSMRLEYSNELTAAAKRAAEAIRKVVEPKSEMQRVFASAGKRSATDTALDEARVKQQEEREQRLRMLTQPGRNSGSKISPVPPSPVGNTTTMPSIAAASASKAPQSSSVPRTTTGVLSRTTRDPIASTSPASTGGNPDVQPMLLPLSPPTVASSPGLSQGSGSRGMSPAISTLPAPKRKRPVNLFMPVKRTKM